MRSFRGDLIHNIKKPLKGPAHHLCTDYSALYNEVWERLSLSYGTDVVGREQEKSEILQWMKGALAEVCPFVQEAQNIAFSR